MDFDQLERIASALIQTFGIQEPPIPIEIMLQHPKPNMWDEVDITQLSVSFLKTGGPYSPRMSLTRLLARHIIRSEWGAEHGITAIIKGEKIEDVVQIFARMLIMPLEMIQRLSSHARTPAAMSAHFEVPEEDANRRLGEVAHRL